MVQRPFHTGSAERDYANPIQASQLRKMRADRVVIRPTNFHGLRQFGNHGSLRDHEPD